jgi:hypothetical protein
MEPFLSAQNCLALGHPDIKAAGVCEVQLKECTLAQVKQRTENLQVDCHCSKLRKACSLQVGSRNWEYIVRVSAPEIHERHSCPDNSGGGLQGSSNSGGDLQQGFDVCALQGQCWLPMTVWQHHTLVV